MVDLIIFFGTIGIVAYLLYLWGKCIVLRVVVCIFVLVWMISYMYIKGNTPERKAKSELACNSTLIVNCKAQTFQYKSTDGKLSKVYDMPKKLDIHFLNEFKTVVVKYPKCEEFRVDTFSIDDIEFLDEHQFINGHDFDHVQDWR